MIRRILVGLGGEDYTTSAINQAVALAQAHRASITGVSVVDEVRLARVGPVPVGAGPYALDLAEQRVAEAKEHASRAIEEFLEACLASHVPHTLIRDIGEPFDDFIAQARYHDLMVFGLRHIFEYDVIEDPHDVLVRLVQAGVRPIIAVAKGYRHVRKVLIAYSGSMESAKAMKHFVQLRLWPEAMVRIVSFDDGRDNVQQQLADAAEYCHAHDLEVETDHVAGDPRDMLLPYMDAYGADLTVIGNSARNLLMRRVFGETALHAIRNAERPLFIAQ